MTGLELDKRAAGRGSCKIAGTKPGGRAARIDVDSKRSRRGMIAVCVRGHDGDDLDGTWVGRR